MPAENRFDAYGAVDAPTIPSIDLQIFHETDPANQAAIAQDVDDICRSIGFLVIENHGIDKKLMDNTWSTIRRFFDLPLAEKLKSKSRQPGCPRGYFPVAAESLARSRGVETPPDIKESFGVGPLRAPELEMSGDEFEFHFGENLWPEQPGELRQSLERYFMVMEDLGARLMRLFAAALKLPQDYFAPFHVFPMCALRCINYPATDGALLSGQRGAGEHTDYGSITVLKSDPHIPGLEIKLSTGEWAKAPVVDDAFIVNIGDMMARWTNDRWVSTMHRVSTPTESNGGTRRRQSIAFFHNTNYDAEIACIPTCLAEGEKPKYDLVRGGDYLNQRFNAASNTI